MLFRETVAVYCENHTEHTNTLCGQKAELYVKASGTYNNHVLMQSWRMLRVISSHRNLWNLLRIIYVPKNSLDVWESFRPVENMTYLCFRWLFNDVFQHENYTEPQKSNFLGVI
jgi:hypothetical protein